MNYIDNLGFLGFGTRLKILSDTIMNEAGEAYKLSGIDFEARWFTTFYLIANSENPISVTEIAHSLNISHPAIIKITNILLKKDLIQSSQGESDKRKRLFKLSKKGKDLIPKLEPLWKAFSTATKQLFEETDIDMISIMTKLELSLNHKPLSQRVFESYKEILNNMIEIVEFSSELKDNFKDLNIEWIKKYFEVEETDLKILNNPEIEILDKNGAILFAKIGDRIIGTGAIHEISNSIFTISKMAVTSEYQSRGAGTKLLEELIEFAKSKDANEIILLTDQKLTSAISLYRKAGFSITSPEKYELENYERASDAILLKLDIK